MAHTVLLKRSSTASAVPTAGQLSAGELAINTVDEKIFFKNSGGTVKSLSAMSDLTSNLVTISTTQTITGSKTFSLDVTMSGDLAVNGGDITTTAATATLFNTNATTISAFGAATTCTVGYAGSSTHTLNLAVAALGASQVKTVNIGTGSGNATKVANINIGSAGGSTYLGSGGGVFIGDSSGSSPTTLYVDTIAPYTALGSLYISGVASPVNITSTGAVFVGDDGAANGTGITVDDSLLNINMFAGSGVSLASQTQLRFLEAPANGTNYVGFKAPASITANLIWTLPASDGTSGQVLSTNGTGTLSWTTASGSGGTPGGSNTQVQFNDSSAFGGDAGLTYNKTTDTLSVGTGATAGYVNINGQGELRLNDADSSNYVAIKSPATVTNNVTWIMPSADGAGGQVLTTNGSGTLSWATPPAVELALFNMGII